MSGLTPYVIGDFVSGLTTTQQPWRRMPDAWGPMINAYVYRGTLTKRAGYTLFGNQLADQTPVMGLMQRIDESTGAISLIAASTKALYTYSSGSNTFSPIVTVGGANSIFWTGTATGTITMPTFWPNISPGTASVTDGTTTITFNSGGSQVGSGGIFAAGGSLNQTTGSLTLNFSGSTAGVSLKFSATLVTPTSIAGGYFTGTNSNFFNWTNWQPTDPATLTQSTSYFYCTNNVDPLTIFDGTNLARPILYVDSTHTQYLGRMLDVKVYKNRLLAIRPSRVNAASPATYLPLNQSIYYSALFNPFNFVGDVPGNGGQLTAATGDIIQAIEPLRDAQIVFFTNGPWLFRYTGLDFNPFRFDRISSTKTSGAPYATLAFDKRCTSIGNQGMFFSDGDYTERYDQAIVNYFEEEISEQFYAQCFAQRYDNLDQAWMLYVSPDNTQLNGNVAPGSDKALIYNFLENTWATFSFVDNPDAPGTPNGNFMSCLGLFYKVSGTTWAQATFTWASADLPWWSYSTQKLAPILLAGDINGYVYHLDDDIAEFDENPAGGIYNILPNLQSTRWNPGIESGQKTQFVYLDVYYTITSNTPAAPVQVTLNFFADNSDVVAKSQTLTFDGPTNQDSAWKRVYVNLIGEFVRLQIAPAPVPSEGIVPINGDFNILGFVLWTKPSGRLTP